MRILGNSVKFIVKFQYQHKRYSRYDQRIIWQHPSEKHINKNEDVTNEYWFWREKEMTSRDPVGFSVRSSCVDALWSNEKDEYRNYDYVEAKKKIFLFLKLMVHIKNQ